MADVGRGAGSGGGIGGKLDPGAKRPSRSKERAFRMAGEPGRDSVAFATFPALGRKRIER